MSAAVKEQVTAGTFTVLFPIEDPDMKQGELKAEAKERTIQATDDVGLVRTSPVRVELDREKRLISTIVQVKWAGKQPVIRGYVD